MNIGSLLTRKKQKNIIESIHKKPIAHVLVVEQLKLALLIDMQGQASLHYFKSDQIWQHRSTLKLFQCPVIAYHHTIRTGQLIVVFVGLNNNVKICRVVQEKFIAIESQIDLISLKQNIVNICWIQQNSVLLGGNKGGIFKLNLITKQTQIVLEVDSSSVKIDTDYKGDTFISHANILQKIILTTSKYENQKVFRFPVIKQAGYIQDFIMSKQRFYGNLVILTNNQIKFYSLDKSGHEAEYVLGLDISGSNRRASWGKSEDEVCVYSQLNGQKLVEIFRCNLEGDWYAVGK